MLRARHAAFVEAFMDELSKTPNVEAAAMEAVDRTIGSAYGVGWTDKRRLKKAKELLKRDDVTHAIAEAFEVATGFTRLDGARMLVRHISGLEYETQEVTKDGDVVTYQAKLPPSLQALKEYFNLTMPKPTKQVQVDSRTIHGVMPASGLMPTMRARVLPSPGKPPDAE